MNEITGGIFIKSLVGVLSPQKSIIYVLNDEFKLLKLI